LTGGRWQWLERAWYRGAWWLPLLYPLEWAYRAVAGLRRAPYRLGLLQAWRAPVPVVVVGNLVVGGSGKTPVVIALAQALADAGLRVGIVARGYGGRAGPTARLVPMAGEAAAYGDEAVLLRERTGCPVAVAVSRPAAVRALLAAHPVDIVLSDDGLQHHALARDFEVIMVDANRGPGNGHCLPAGPLREPARRLRRADCVLYRGGADPATAVRYRSDCLVNLRTGAQRPVSAVGLAPEVHAVAGIARPEDFLATLVAAGFRVRARLFADHHPYVPADLAALRGLPVIMTEKDAVKCRRFAGEDAWFLRISALLPTALPRRILALVRDEAS